jgi:hypothetical protein
VRGESGCVGLALSSYLQESLGFSFRMDRCFVPGLCPERI